MAAPGSGPTRKWEGDVFREVSIAIAAPLKLHSNRSTGFSVLPRSRLQHRPLPRKEWYSACIRHFFLSVLGQFAQLSRRRV